MIKVVLGGLFGWWRRKPRHGGPTICTRCGAAGRWDMSPGPDAVLPDAVWVLTRDHNGTITGTLCWACCDD